MAQMGAKIQVFKDPYFDRAAETQQLMNQFQQMIGDNRKRDLQKEELQKRKDDLELGMIKRQGIDHLANDLTQACNAYDNMADDLENQIADI